MKPDRRWLLPNRSDAHAWALLLLYVTMLLLPLICQLHLGNGYQLSARGGLVLWALPYLATWLALTAMIGSWDVPQWRRGWKVALLGLGSLVGLIGFSYYLGLLGRGPLDPYLDFPVDRYRFQVLTIAGAGLLVGLGSALIGLVARKLGWRFRQVQVSRTRIMMGGAIALFGISICVRVVQNSDGLSWVNSSPLAGVHPAWWLLPVLLASLPAWLLQKIRGFWILLGFVAVYFLASFLLTVSVLFLTMRIDVAEANVVALIYSFLLVLMMLLLRQPLDHGAQRPEASEKSAVTPRWISVWGFAPGVALPGLHLLMFWLDPVMLVCWQGPDRWKLARSIRVMETMPGTQTRIAPSQWMPGFGGNGLDMLVVFSSETPSHYFEALPELETSQFWLAIRNLQTDIDTAPLARSTGQRPTFVSVTDGKITGRQFHDLVQGSQRVYLSKLVVEPMSDAPQVDQAGFVHLAELGPGETGQFVKLLADQASIGQLILSDCDLNRQDCKSLFKLSRSIPVDLYFWQEKRESLSADLIAVGQTYRGSQVTVRSSPQFFNERERWELLLSTDIGKTIELVDGASANSASRAAPDQARLEEFWDAVFVARKMSRASRAVDGVPRSKGSSFLDDCVRYHWAYGSDPIDPQQIESLFLPHFEPWQLGEVGRMPSLKNLSLDSTWLPIFQEAPLSPSPLRVDLKPIQNLAELKRLVLPAGLQVRDFDFLQGLNNLEHLQFDTGFVDQALVNPKFCPRLRTVSMFGLPSARMLQALLQIKSLEKVILIDSPHHLLDEDERQTVRRLLAGRVELQFVPWNDDRVPQAFSDHLVKVRRSVRGKYLGFGQDWVRARRSRQDKKGPDVVPEHKRWQIDHDAENISQYAEQLSFFDLDIAFIQMDSSDITRLRDVAGNPQVIESKRSKERKTLWFPPSNEKLKGWDETLVKKHGVELENGFTALFYPVETREMLRQIENQWLDQRGQKLSEVRQTRFMIVPVDQGFEFRLKGISLRYQPVP